MASTVAKRLVDRGDVDLVFCFAPSINVSNSFKATLEGELGGKLNGLLGSKGHVLTYQSMLNLDQSFWSLLKSHRTLVIFDEIHHCSGDRPDNANTWGQKIIQHIQGIATYTLALTGTPWRSDRIPIALTSYCREGKVHCDYSYGLDEAIRDEVCRKPQIIAVDNEKITVKTENSEERYRSIDDFLINSRCNYQQLIENPILIRYFVSLCIKKLNAIRRHNPNAGGLFVATSVDHALQIASILEEASGEPPEVVTYIHDDSQKAIQDFRSSFTKWIISVGMISEGTDIPRLQVCCHLTRVKTELHYRQVLGRILRLQQTHREKAIFIMPAEPQLVKYAQRVAEDIPSEKSISIELLSGDFSPTFTSGNQNVTDELKNQIADIAVSNLQPCFSEEQTGDSPASDQTKITKPSLATSSLAEAYESTIGIFGRFKKRMIELPVHAS